MGFRICLVALLSKWTKLSDSEVKVHSLVLLTSPLGNSVSPLFA